MKEIKGIESPYKEMAKRIVQDALTDGQELRYFNNLFVEIAKEVHGKVFDFEGTVFTDEGQFLDFLSKVLEWNKELSKQNEYENVDKA